MIANVVDEEGEALECLFQLRLNGCVVQHFLMGLDKRLHPFLLFFGIYEIIIIIHHAIEGVRVVTREAFGVIISLF